MAKQPTQFVGMGNARQIAQSEAERAIQSFLKPFETMVDTRLESLQGSLAALTSSVEELKKERVGSALTAERVKQLDEDLNRIENEFKGVRDDVKGVAAVLVHVRTALAGITADLNAIKEAREREANERRKELVKYGGGAGLLATLIPLVVWLAQIFAGADAPPPPAHLVQPPPATMPADTPSALPTMPPTEGSP